MLSSDEKRALRQKQGLLYSSGQFPLVGNNSGPSRRARRRMSPVKALVTGLAVGLFLLVGLIVLLTSSARAAPLTTSPVTHSIAQAASADVNAGRAVTRSR